MPKKNNLVCWTSEQDRWRERVDEEIHSRVHWGGAGLNVPSSEHVTDLDPLRVKSPVQLYCTTSWYLYMSLTGLKRPLGMAAGGSHVNTAKSKRLLSGSSKSWISVGQELHRYYKPSHIGNLSNHPLSPQVILLFPTNLKLHRETTKACLALLRITHNLKIALFYFTLLTRGCK